MIMEKINKIFFLIWTKSWKKYITKSYFCLLVIATDCYKESWNQIYQAS